MAACRHGNRTRISAVISCTLFSSWLEQPFSGNPGSRPGRQTKRTRLLPFVSKPDHSSAKPPPPPPVSSLFGNVRDESVRPTETTMDNYVMGFREAVAIIQAWKPLRADFATTGARRTDG